MSDKLPTVWPAEPHTIAKHRILQEYLAAWIPILVRQAVKVGAIKSTIRYVDGFAGPGIYEGGEKGSPLLAADSALQHADSFQLPVELTFIEEKPDRCSILRSHLSNYSATLLAQKNVTINPPICGDCATVLAEMIRARKPHFGPALVFLDQFGYTSVPMNLIKQILDQPFCEVFSYLFWRDLDRFITDETKHEGITAAFGGTEWIPAINLPSGERDKFMLQTYVDALRKKAGAKYVWPFAMFDDNNRLLYWLFFATNNPRGLEEMKKAMTRVDRSGSYSFSDRTGFGQLTLFGDYSDADLANDIHRRLGGQTLTVKEMFEWVLVHTPAYKFKTALELLQRRDNLTILNPPPGYRRGFADENMRIQIADPPLF